MTVSVGKRAWQVKPEQAVPSDLPGQAKKWATSHATETTLADAALALHPVLEKELGEPFELAIPGSPPTPTAMALHPTGNLDRAHIGIFIGSFHVGDAVVPIPEGRRMARACLDVVQYVRGQIAAYERNVILAKACERVAAELANKQGKSWRADGLGGASYARAMPSLVIDRDREVARVVARDGAVWVDAGLPDGGWHGTAEQAFSDIEAVAQAVKAMEGVVTYDALQYNREYLVIDHFHGLKKGEVVTYGGPIDNHAPHSFKRGDGQEVLIDEHDLRESAHRIFSPIRA